MPDVIEALKAGVKRADDNPTMRLSILRHTISEAIAALSTPNDTPAQSVELVGELEIEREAEKLALHFAEDNHWWDNEYVGTTDFSQRMKHYAAIAVRTLCSTALSKSAPSEAVELLREARGYVDLQQPDSLAANLLNRIDTLLSGDGG